MRHPALRSFTARHHPAYSPLEGDGGQAEKVHGREHANHQAERRWPGLLAPRVSGGPLRGPSWCTTGPHRRRELFNRQPFAVVEWRCSTLIAKEKVPVPPLVSSFSRSRNFSLPKTIREEVMTLRACEHPTKRWQHTPKSSLERAATRVGCLRGDKSVFFGTISPLPPLFPAPLQSNSKLTPLLV